MRKNLILLLVGMACLVTACGEYLGEPPYIEKFDPRGELISVNAMESWTVPQVDSILSQLQGANLFIHPQYPVAIYRIVYKTIDPFGNPTIASGAFAVPMGAGLEAMPLVSYQHGTETKDVNVASFRNDEVILGIIYATTGYLCTMPDLLGLGDSPGLHPYIHAKSEATAVIDMLRACRDFLPTVGREWDHRLYLFGYSQGGHSTMAAHREIQQYYSDEFEVTGSAPMAGPYDCSGVQSNVITSFDPYPTPGYLPYVLFSYNMIYHIVPDAVALLKPPYDSIIPPLFSGAYSIGEINQVSNAVPRYMIKDSVMAAYEADPDHPLKVALRKNDLYNWVPRAPVKMFYCSSDDQVNYMNSIVAYEHFMAAGATNVSLFNTGNTMTHGECAAPTMLYGKLYIDSLRALPH